MKNFFTLIFSLLFSVVSFAQLNMTLVGSIDYGQVPGPWSMSDVWGYVADDGTEYALVGLPGGVSIVNLSDPSNPTEEHFLTGPEAFWRDIKVWEDFAYVSMDGNGNGITVIDLSGLPEEATQTTWAPDLAELGGVVQTVHNIWIDEHGFLYLSGGNVNNGGVVWADLADPANPVFAGHGDNRPSHDVIVRDNIMYSSDINDGYLSITDVSDKGAPQLLSTQHTPDFFTHNAWLSDDGNYVFTTDEVPNGSVAAYDISDPENVQALDIYRPYATLGSDVIPHNVLVWQNWLVISYYTDGVILVDATRPENLVEVGNFDTFVGGGGTFNGVWGVYPYLPSGLVLASDMTGQFYVFEPNYVRACYLEGTVTDANTGAAIFNAKITVASTPIIETTGLTGDYYTGLATAGTYTAHVDKAGYEPFTAEVELENGEITILNAALTPLEGVSISGLVINEESGQIVPNAKVAIFNNDFRYNTTTDVNGNFTIDNFLEGTYDVFAGKWGFETGHLDSEEILSTTPVILELEPGIEDIFMLDLGWTVESDVTSGAWELAVPPTGNMAGPGIFISPNDDSPLDDGVGCYVTGNDLGGPNTLYGKTRLISPPFGFASDEGDPRLRMMSWLFTTIDDNIPPNGVGNEKLYIIVDNGIEEVILDSIEYNTIVAPNWRIHLGWKLKEHIELTENMRAIFEIENPDEGFVEAGIDFFRVTGGDLLSDVEEILVAAPLLVYPNPSAEAFTLEYDLDNKNTAAQLLVFNALGQQVEIIPLSNHAATILVGANWSKGIYFLQIQGSGAGSRSLKVVKQ